MTKSLIIFITLAFFAIACNQPRRSQAQTVNSEIVVEQEENTIIEKIVGENSEIEYLCRRKLRIFGFTHVPRSVSEDKNVVLVSLSDIDPLCRIIDPLTYTIKRFYFSNCEEQKNRHFFELNAEYRRQFFERTGVSETDYVFVYDYVADVLLVFPVKELSVFALIDWIRSRDTPPHPICDYHIGFLVNSADLTELGNYFNALVYIGKAHPFIRKGLQEIVWEKINSEDFPVDRAQIDAQSVIYDFFRGYDYFINSYAPRENYMSEWKQFRLYVQDWYASWEGDAVRHLLIFNTKNNELIVERIFRALGEHEWLTSLNGQQIGYLFQNRPPVIFQFDSISGWCTYFIFLDPAMDDLHVMCDNRW